MHIVVGGTGHVGSAVARTLLDEGEAVTIVTRSPEKASPWRQRGAEVVLADVQDVTSMHEVFRRGTRAFLLNPPADISSDTDREERRTVRCLLEALEGSGLEKVVAESTMGAQPGEECGDLNVLYELEVGLRDQPIPASIIRAAYYYSNWDTMVGPVTKDGFYRPCSLPTSSSPWSRQTTRDGSPRDSCESRSGRQAYILSRGRNGTPRMMWPRASPPPLAGPFAST